MKLTPVKIKKYNKIAAAGKKPIMVRVGHKWYTWAEGDPKYGVFLTTQSGKDVEFDFKQIDDIQEGVMKLTKSKLREIIKQELNEYEKGTPESVGEDLVEVANELQREFKRIKFDKIREWGKKYYRSAPGLLNMLTNVLKWVRKIK